MSRLNNFYQSAKRHTGKIVAGALIGGALAGIRGCIKNMGEEIYRGNIDGQEVVYEEGRSALKIGSSFTKNRMVVRNGNQTYTFLDVVGENGIESSDFEGQQLEKILINSEKGDQSYFSQKEYGQNLDEQHTKSVFEKGNALYNSLRGKIRAEIESGYKAIEQQIPR